MSQLTAESPVLFVELPVPLIQQIQERKVSDERLTEAIVQFVYLYINEHSIVDHGFDQTWLDPIEFTKGLISKHRKVFEELAKR